MWRQALFIARKDLAYLLRKRETLVWTFFMPVVFFYFIGTVTGGFGGGGGPRREELTLVAPADAGFLADEAARRLEEQGYQVVRAATAPAKGRRVVLPPGFTASVLAGRQVKVGFAPGDDGPGASYDQVRVSRALYTLLADVIVSAQPGQPPATPEAFARLRGLPRTLTLEVTSAGRRRHIPTGFEQAIPGTTVMFTLLVLLTSGAVLLVNERREGLLRRLAMTPIPRGAVVLGKWMGRMALGLVQIAFALLAGTLLFGVRWGPHWPTVLLVLFLYAGLNASLGLMLGGVARTEGQAVAVGVLASNVLAALGGCWWPIEVTPGWMQKLSLALPTGWAMDALHKLVSFQAGPATVVPHLLAFPLAALAAGWAAARLFRYE
ncbi:MAG TPA: ABC transporter permease [Vicinamibacteria bacterium]